VATDVTTLEGEGHVSVPLVPEAPRTHTVKGPHRTRFVMIYGLLAVVLGAAVVGLVIFAGKSISPAPAWSAWKPSGGGLGAAKQIAAQVGEGYRLPSGSQLVDVIAKAPSVSPASNETIPIQYVALHGMKSTADQIVAVSSSDSVMYSLCGLGASCAIATGKASVQRGTLVRREILELALYTFKYVGGIKSVIAFVPPTPGAQPKYVVYLQKSDLSSELKVPLAQTLATKVPPVSAIPAHDTTAVNETTGTRTYSFSLTQTQTGDAVLVLAPVAA
jgi:hypothetical protein